VCNCKGFIRDGIPCRHEYAVAFHFGMMAKLRPVLSFNETEIIRNSLSKKIHHIDLSKLQSSDYIKTPIIKKHSGRPKTKRFRSFSEINISKRLKKASKSIMPDVIEEMPDVIEEMPDTIEKMFDVREEISDVIEIPTPIDNSLSKVREQEKPLKTVNVKRKRMNTSERVEKYEIPMTRSKERRRKLVMREPIPAKRTEKERENKEKKRRKPRM